MSLQEVTNKTAKRRPVPAMSKRSSNFRLKRSLTVNGHKTSLSLEKPFWDALTAIREKDRCSLSNLIVRIDDERDQAEAANLSSAIRIYILKRALSDNEDLKLDIDDLNAKLARVR